MANNLEFRSFQDAREKDLSLREIKNEIKKLSQEQREQLSKEINNEIIQALQKGLVVKKGDELNFLRALTLEGNTITWTNKKEANLIHTGDIIKIEGSNILKNGNIIGNVTGFSIENTQKEQIVSTSDAENKIPTIQKPGNKQEDLDQNQEDLDQNQEQIDGDWLLDDEKYTDNINSMLHFREARSSRSILGSGPQYEAGETLVEAETYNKFENELLEKTNDPKLKMIIALSQIWIDGARKEIPKQWSLMGLRKDKEALEEGIDGVTEDLNQIISISLDTTKDIRDIDKIINSIFKTIRKAQKNGEKILGEINNIGKLFQNLNHENYEERLAKMLELSAGGFILDGNTQKSKEIARDIIINKHFLDAKNSIQNINDIDSLKINYFISPPFNLNRKQAQEIIKEIKDTYKKVKSETEKQREKIIKNFRDQNPDFEGNITTEVNKIIETSSKMQALKMAEEMFVDYKIGGISNDKIAETYKDLNSSWQATKEFLAENGVMIALSLIPMGAGFVAVGIAAKGASMAMKGATLANYGRGVQIAGNSAKGVVFYQGMNLTNNALYQDSFGMDLLKGSLDSKELVKSALFFNIMGIVSKFTTPGAKMISAQSMKSISAEIALFTGVDLGVELGFGEEMTMEQFANSVVTGGIMTIMSRGAGNITNGYARGSKVDSGKKINNQSREVIAEAKKIKANRAKDGSTSGDYLKYNQKYKDLYKKLDKDGITDPTRGQLIKKLDREIAREIVGKKGAVENVKPKAKESKIKEGAKTYEKAFNNVKEGLTSSKEFMSMIDKRLSGLPLHIDKLYKIPKWTVHNGEKFRYLPREMAAPVTTPIDFYLNMKKKNYPQAVKNVLFNSNDITWKGGILKIGTYTITPAAIDFIHTIATTNGFDVTMSSADFVEKIGEDYGKYMYLGVINTIILESLGYND